MAIPNDDLVAAILADMRDSQAPSDLSNQVSNEKWQFRLRGRSATFPAAPQASTDRRGFQLTTEQNRLPGDETLCVLKKHVSKSSCPVGLQYRPRPHLRPDQNFNTDLRKICEQAEQALLQLMIQQQEKNVNADTEAINALKQKLNTMIPDRAKREQAEKWILSATSRSNFRASKHRRANKQQNKADDINDLKAKISELTTLVNSFSKLENKKERVPLYSNCDSLTLTAPNPCEPRLSVKSDPLNAKPLEISTKTNLGLLMRNSLKICPVQTLLTKKMLCLQKASNLSQHL